MEHKKIGSRKTEQTIELDELVYEVGETILGNAMITQDRRLPGRVSGLHLAAGHFSG